MSEQCPKCGADAVPGIIVYACGRLTFDGDASPDGSLCQTRRLEQRDRRIRVLEEQNGVLVTEVERLQACIAELAVAIDIIDEAMRLWGEDDVGCGCDNCRVTRKGRALVDKWDTRKETGDRPGAE